MPSDPVPPPQDSPPPSRDALRAEADGDSGGDSDATPLSALAEAVAALCARHGVGRRHLVSTLAEVLGLTGPAVRRRQHGEVPWAVPELQAIAAHFGEDFAFSFSGEAGGAETPRDAAEQGRFRTGTLDLPCRFTRWPAPGAIGRSPLVAYPDQGRWTVMPAAALPPGQAGQQVYAVRELTLQSQPAIGRVAILDDDVGLSRLYQDALRAAGYEAEGFSRPEALLQAAGRRAYDAYILDWLIDSHETSEPACRTLRARDPEALMVLLTGKLATNAGVDETRLLQTALELRLEPVEKPVRPSFLAAKIERHLADRGPGRVSIPG